MKHHPLSFLVLGLLTFMAAGRAQQPSPPAANAGTPAPTNLTDVIDLPQQTLVFAPTREDFTVGTVVFTVIQLDAAHPERGAVHPAAARINDVAPKGTTLYLKRAGKNQFELPALKIQYSREDSGGPIYLALKVWFDGISNQDDPFYYQNHPDRYALLTYCTNESEDPAKVNVRWGANRATTLNQFKEKLAQPLAINLNQEPLREGAGYPMVNDAFTQLGPSDLRALRQLMQDRDETHLLAINSISPDHANVHASVRDFTQFYGKRIYQAVKTDGAWHIESVETVNNSF